MLKAYKGAIRAYIPLIVSRIALLVGLTSTLGRIRKDLIILGPGVADAEGGAADVGVLPVRYAHSNVVQVGTDAGEGSATVQNKSAGE
jgi:hypothetical protein